jgi:hypothetical protein
VSARSEHLDRALAAIDAANAADPHLVGGRPRAQLQGERATAWLARLDAAAGDALVLAARAHHVRRWVIPRDDYPAGRAGYLRWRRDLKTVHAQTVAELLEPIGIDSATIARVQQLVQKQGLGSGSNPEVQTFEDVVCLVFLETQYEELSDRLDDDKMVDVLRKTLPKMSPAAHALAAEAVRYPHGRVLLERALDAPPPTRSR